MSDTNKSRSQSSINNPLPPSVQTVKLNTNSQPQIHQPQTHQPLTHQPLTSSVDYEQKASSPNAPDQPKP